MRKKWMAHGIALIGLVVFSVLGVGSTTTPAAVEVVEVVEVVEAVEAPTGPAEIMLVPSWSPYTLIPSLNYEVIGAVVVRNTSTETFLADLMDRAIAMGGHFIKNVRLSVITEGEGRDATRSVNTATATVIRYTDETLRYTVTDTFIFDDEQFTITNDRLLSVTGANE